MRNWYVLVKPLRIEKARECLVHDTGGDRYGLQPLVRAPSSQPPILSSIFLLSPLLLFPNHSPFLWQRPSTYTFCTTLSTLILSGGRTAVNVLLTIAYFVRWYTAIVSLPFDSPSFDFNYEPIKEFCGFNLIFGRLIFGV